MTAPIIEVPKSEEAERATLGSIMIEPSAFLEVSSILNSGDDFFFLKHRIIWQAMESIITRKEEIDPIVLADSLEKSGDLELVGGRAYLMQLSMDVGTSMNVSVYAKIVKRTGIRRKMMGASGRMFELAKDESLDINDIRSQADKAWLDATSLVTENKGAWMADVASEYYDYLEKLMNGKIEGGLKTGLRDVDALLAGLSPSQLIILAARPGVGKSAAMDNIALNIAKQGTPVFYATSERSKHEVMQRMVSIWSGVNSLKMQHGKLTGQEASRITTSIAEIGALPIFFEDSPMPRPRDIQVQADWMIKRHGCKLILFDGMYRAETGDKDIDKSDRTKYGKIALDLKTMARTLNVPVLVTHQLNRSLESRQDKRPMMSDLRESGRIEEEADKIVFLYRDEIYNQNTEFEGSCEWIVAKHRNGGLGTVNTHYEKQITKFMDATTTKINLLD